MKNNVITIGLAVAIIAGGAGFIGGKKYQESKTPQFTRNIPSDFQGRISQSGQRSSSQGLRPVSGEILSIDEESITVKLPDNSSKIIFLTETSAINKTEQGSKDDLAQGTEVVVFGQENEDGSITAQSIQVGNMMFRESPEQ